MEYRNTQMTLGGLFMVLLALILGGVVLALMPGKPRGSERTASLPNAEPAGPRT